MRGVADATVGELRAEVRGFLGDELAAGRFEPGVDTWLSGWDAAFSRRLAERGWVGMTIPAAYGGHGRSPLERYAVVEELLAVGAPVAAHWVADRQTAPSLLHLGTEEQKEFFLPRIARAQCSFAIGMSEPDSGSDLASVRTRAERVDGGWRLSGTKVWTSGAHEADFFFVLARSAPVEADRHAGLTQFIVDLHAPGISVRPIPLLTGAAHFNEVVLDGVAVPDSRVLGEVGAGWRQVSAELAYERSGPERFLSTYLLLSTLVGELARRPGAELGGLGALVARLATLREMSFGVAAALAAGQTPATQAALVKDLGTRFEQAVIDVARAGLRVEPDPDAPADTAARRLAHAVLHAPGFTLRGGTNEILRGIVARALTAGS